MQQLQLSIALADGQTLQASPRPEDERRLAEILAERATIELTPSGDVDVEGHALSTDVQVDVEGHAIAIRLPNGTDAAALRRALAVGAVTATIVGAGAIAALQSQPQTPATVVPAPAQENTLTVPGPAVRAQEAESLRQGELLAVPNTVQSTGEDIEVMTQSQVLAVPNTAQSTGEEIEVMTQSQVLAVPGTADDDSQVAPAPAQNALDAELDRQR